MEKVKNQGFTLIELLIVIGIIAILAAAVIVAINPGKQFEQARNATRWSHMNSIVNAVYSYAITEGGSFPDCDDAADVDSLNDEDSDPRDVSNCYIDLVEGGFAHELPRDPQIGIEGGNTGYMIELVEGTRIRVYPHESVGDNVQDLEVIQ